MGSSEIANLIGRRYGRLVVVGYARGRGIYMRWLCRCDCGKEMPMTTGLLRRGVAESCGGQACREANDREVGERGRPPSYQTWLTMIDRCYSPYSAGYHRYGKRGIRMCERWLFSFEAFSDDMGPRPSPEHSSIDRINNDGNYEPGNCRWATRHEQALNKGNTRRLSAFGKVLPIMEWAEQVGMKSETIRQRVDRGYSPERALTQPILRPGRRGKLGKKRRLLY